MIADEKRLVFDCLVDKGKSRLRAWAKFGDCFRVEGTKSCRLPAPARIGVQMYSQGIMCKMIAQCPKVSVAMNTVEVALAVILWQIFPLRRNIVSMLPALWPMDRKTWT